MDAPRDNNFVPATLFEIDGDPGQVMPGQIDQLTGRILVDATGGGTGTVTSVSVATANGFAGTVSNPTTTPAITISTTINSPVLAGNGTAISAATTTGSGSTVVLATAPTFPTSLTVGAAAGSTGTVLFKGTTSGTVTLSVADAAGTWTMKLPTSAGTNGYFLKTDGSGNTSWDTGPAASLTVGSTSIASGTTTRILYDNAGVLGEYTITGSGTVVAMATNPTLSGLTMADATNIVLDTTTGTKIGTATTQKLGFYNAIPIVQPTGDVVTALQNLGLGASLTIAADTVKTANEATDTTCFPLFVTASGTQTLQPKNNTSLTFNSSTASLGATLITATTSVTSASILASSNDSGALGASGTAFADLFLASGGVINWNAGNATLTHSAGLLTSNVSLSLGTSNALTTGTIELGNASDTTLSRSSAGVLAVEGVVIPSISSTNTFTNKFITPQLQSVADAGGTLTPVSITNDLVVATALSQATTIAAPSGSPVQGEKLIIRLKDDGTARALTWNAIYRAGTTVSLPTTTTISKTLYCGFIYNSTDSKWDLLAYANGF